MANRMLPFAAAARAVLGEVSAQDVLGADALPWRRAMQILQGDPQAAIDIELPAPVVPSRPVPFHAQGPLVRMTSIQQPAVPQLPSAPDDGDLAVPDPPQ
jgi:hypothetical protein